MFYLGLFLVLYALIVFWISIKKPAKVWRMGKIQGFVKILGDLGTQVFLAFFGLAALGVGIWLTIVNWPG